MARAGTPPECSGQPWAAPHLARGPLAQVAYVGFDAFGAAEQEPVMVETPLGLVAIQQDGAAAHAAPGPLLLRTASHQPLPEAR